MKDSSCQQKTEGSLTAMVLALSHLLQDKFLTKARERLVCLSLAVALSPWFRLHLIQR